MVTHLKFKHLTSVEEYRLQYGECKVYLHSEELRNKISKTLKKLNKNSVFRKQNSERQKKGASCLTIKYWMNKGYDKEGAIHKVSELQKNNSQKHLKKNNLQECSHFSDKYWIKRGYNEKDAIEKVRCIQSKLSSRSSKFKGHIRTDDQKERISSSVKRMINIVGKGTWASHFGEFKR